MKDAAFPQTSYNEGGMTLRDYFAAQVLANSWYSKASNEAMARLAYEIADAMMKERSK